MSAARKTIAAVRLIAVIRVSRRAGREGSSFLSPKEQREEIKRYAKRMGYQIVAWVDETDSVSGKTTERRGLQSATEAVFAGQADGIIVAKIDRFARNLVEGLTAVKKLHKKNKRFIAVKEGIDGDRSDKYGKMLLSILFMFAEWQWDSLCEEWSATNDRVIAEGKSRKTPYGFRRNPETKVLEIREDEAKWVRWMYERRAQGASWHGIADDLTAAGVKPKGGAARWSYSSVRSIITNRIYLGELRAGERVNLTAHEAIIDADLWARVERMFSTTPIKRTGKPSSQLAGMVRCAGCGTRAPMSANVDGSTYYRCKRKHSFGMCPAPMSVSAKALDAYVEECFRADFFGDPTSYEAQEGTQLAEAVEALRIAEAKLAEYLDAPETIEMGELLEDGAEWVKRGQLARARQVKEARELVAELRQQETGTLLPTNIAELWPEMDVDERRHVLSLAYGVIAVRASVSYREPARARTRLIPVGHPDMPTDLPSRGGSKGARPIPVA